MTIYYRPALVDGGTTLWLPLPILTWNETPQFDVETAKVPRVDGHTILSSTRGTVHIQIVGRILGASETDSQFDPASALSAENARDIKEAILTFATGRTFWVYRWHDHYYKECVLKSIRTTENRVGQMIDYALEITACDPTVYSTTALETEGAWENWTTQGESGGTVTVPSDDYQTYAVTFHGSPVVTASGQDLVVRPRGPASGTGTVVAIGVAGCSGVLPGSSGNTTARVGVASIGASGSTLSLSVDESTMSGIAHGSLTFDFDSNGYGDPLYVHLSAVDGGHTDLQVYILVRST
ncbi:MAG: hypothetical protein M0R74_18195 [Dehalococcoidia bacterium]|nr:hypothetical protein [Dehalococcoidia bacterium]